MLQYYTEIAMNTNQYLKKVLKTFEFIMSTNYEFHQPNKYLKFRLVTSQEYSSEKIFSKVTWSNMIRKQAH